MRLFKYNKYISEAFGRGSLSESEFTEVESLITELEDKFDFLTRTYDKDNIKVDEYFLGHISNNITDGNYDVSLVINLNEYYFISTSLNYKISEVFNFVKDELKRRLDIIGYKTNIKLLTRKIDSWSFVETGVRLDIGLD
jgi:hypothetical protein